jgi:RNA polymerase-binding transcription factor DksA
MRRHFHRCPSLRLVVAGARELSGARGRGSVVLDELCEARGLAPCLGLLECDLLAPAQKRELLVARATHLRRREGGASVLADGPDLRGRELEALAGDLIEEREAIAAENRRLEVERAAALDALGEAARGQREDLAAAGVTLRMDDALAALRTARLDAIDGLLDAVAAGDRAPCARCGAPIEVARLRAAPDTHVCALCAREAGPPA